MDHPNSDLWLRDQSPEYFQYGDSLKQEAKQTNPKSCCAKCWCKLSDYHKKYHQIDHHEDIFTPARYSPLEIFRNLAYNYGHIQNTGDELVWIKKLVNDPLELMQSKPQDDDVSEALQREYLKRIKKNESEARDTKMIFIDLKDFSEITMI